ncbi:alpha/beta hydrolase [Micromonospora zamorensis]|uniref:alpha/beta hydrolase n=1 Tax=Micromonospora zamorensis TaxID=709883 RepID=UPI003714143D
MIVFVHGFITAGTENHGIFVRAARSANERGYSTVLFDFEGTGYSDGNYEQFRITSAITDLAVVARQSLAEAPCDGRVVLFGQSLGSALALVAQEQLSELVGGLVLWNLSANFAERYPRLFGLSPDADGPQCVDKGYVVGADFLKDAATVDVLSYAYGLQCPTLMLNCIGDGVGDISIADQAARRASRISPLLVRLPATHSFTCQRQLESEAVNVSLDWLDNTFA